MIDTFMCYLMCCAKLHWLVIAERDFMFNAVGATAIGLSDKRISGGRVGRPNVHVLITIKKIKPCAKEL